MTAPRMDRNENGSWFCRDCGHIVILLDDDTHEEEECRADFTDEPWRAPFSQWADA